MQCIHHEAASQPYTDEIGQVVFALAVVGANRANVIEEAVEFERVDPRVDFAKRAFGWRGIPVFHDPCQTAV